MKIFKKRTKTLRFAVIFAVLSIIVSIASYRSFAADIADTPCDSAYFDSLEARAWLEAQREITQNQNLIFKADSVLEYTCFDKFANVLARDALSMFSETQRWGLVLDSTHMDNALQALVGQTLIDYIDANFGHEFLGKRWDFITPKPTGDSDYTPKKIEGGSYKCDIMDRVWKEAKCMDFIEYETKDGFFTFQQYIDDEDKRFFPEKCNEDDRWAGMLETALTVPPWVDDPVFTHLDRLDNINCGKQDFPPIPTGITVRRPITTPKEFEEKICLQIGCHYVPTSLTAGSCKKQ